MKSNETKNDLTFQRGSYVRTDTDLFEQEEEQPEKLNFSWFTVKANMRETEDELREKQRAIKDQIENNVIHPNGVPVGMKNPLSKNTNIVQNKNNNSKKSSHKKKGGGKLARKLKRQQDKLKKRKN